MTGKHSHDSETPAHGQQVITACAFIHREVKGEHELFLAKRADTKKFLPGFYELPGGHVDFGEDAVEGLKREIMEEFGMHISVGDPFFVYTYINKIKGAQTIEVIYFASFSDPVEQLRLNPEDHSRFDWITEAELTNFRKMIDAVGTTEMLGGIEETDPEFEAMKRGFSILNGNTYRLV